MNRTRWTVLLTLLVYTALASASAPRPLSAGGVAVDFASWAPVTPSFDYARLAITAKRQHELAEQGQQYLIPLTAVRLRFLANGDVEEVVTRSRFLLNQEGVHNHGNMSFWVDAFAARAEILQAYALQPQGQRIEVDPAAIQVQTQQDENIFTDSFKVIVPFSNLKPATVLLLQTRTHYFAAKDVLPWSTVYYPDSLHTRDRYEIEMEWDNDSVRPRWQSDFAGMQCKEAKGRRVSCVSANSEVFEDDPDIARYDDVLPQFVVTRAVSWQALAGQMTVVVAQQLEGSAAIAKKARELVAGIDDPAEQVEGIYRYVANEVRYVGLEHGYGGIVPRPTGHTYQRRYGDCKDKASLFIDMARQVGLDAYPVLTSSRRHDTGKVLLPASTYFDHMVACVDLKAAGERCVDLTDTYSSSAQLAGGLQGAIRLDVRAGTEGLTTLPLAQHLWDIRLHAVNHFLDDGAMQEEMTLAYGGATAGWLRSVLSPLTQRERVDWVEENYRDAVGSSTRPQVGFAGVGEPEQDIVLSSKTHYKGLIKDYSKLKRYTEDDYWLLHYYRNKRSENQHHPYTVNGMHYSAEVEYRLVDGQEVTYLGPEIDFTSAYGRFTRRYARRDGVVVVYTEFSLPNRVVPVAEVPRFNTYLDKVLQHAKIEFGVSRD